jgi:transcriptional regulator of acetoin/glycerol metabolism
MVIMSGDRITAADVPETLATRPPAAAPGAAPAGPADLSRYGEVPLRELRDLVERDYILKKLEEHDWNITQAAQALGVERTNLHKKIKQHGLSRAGRAMPVEEGEGEEA